jgi:hypothetical protein
MDARLFGRASSILLHGRTVPGTLLESAFHNLTFRIAENNRPTQNNETSGPILL